MAYENKDGSLFVADLGGVKLPAELEKKVAGDIQATVMRALASVDFKGDVLRRAPEGSPIDFPGHTMGIWSWPLKSESV